MNCLFLKNECPFAVPFRPKLSRVFFFGSLVSHSKHVVVVVVVVEGRKGTATDQLVADEDVAGVLLRVGLLGDEAEELLLGLVVGAVRDAVQRVLVQDPLQKRRQQNQKKNQKNKQTKCHSILLRDSRTESTMGTGRRRRGKPPKNPTDRGNRVQFNGCNGADRIVFKGKFVTFFLLSRPSPAHNIFRKLLDVVFLFTYRFRISIVAIIGPSDSIMTCNFFFANRVRSGANQFVSRK